MNTFIIILLMVITCIVFMKPNIIYRPDGQARSFGVGYDTEGYKKTLYNMPALIVLAILVNLHANKN